MSERCKRCILALPASNGRASRTVRWKHLANMLCKSYQFINLLKGCAGVSGKSILPAGQAPAVAEVKNRRCAQIAYF